MTTDELTNDLTGLHEGLNNLKYLVMEARLSILYSIDDDPVEEISAALGRIGAALRGRREMLSILLEKVINEGIFDRAASDDIPEASAKG